MRGCSVNVGIGLVVAMVVMSALLPAARSLPDVITIGGLFDDGDEEQKSAFRYAVDHVNRENILGRTKLNTDIEMIPPYDSFLASKRVCQLVWSGVAAIFGPQSGQTSAHVQSICDALEIPHIETRWDYRLRRDDYSVNLYPHPSSLSKAYLDLVRLFEWKSFCILYEDNDGLVRLQELLKTPSPHEFKVSIRQLPHGNDFRELLKEVRSSGEQNIILDCRTEKVGLVLKQAQQVDMMSSYHSYLITSMDLHLVDLEDFKYSGSNITGLRLIDPNREEVKALVETWRQGRVMATNRLSDGDPVLKPRELSYWTTETALMYDAVKLFVLAIGALDNSTTVTISQLRCEGEQAWEHGNSLINYMKLEKLLGYTGHIEFDSYGFRTEFTMDIIQLGPNNLTKVGTWNKKTGTNYTRTQNETIKDVIQGLHNKTLIVSFAFNDPYIMLKESAEQLNGNDRYEGFCIDLLNHIAAILKFKYELVPVPGNAYGSRNKTTNKWNGMLRELIEERAEMAITDLTINYEREEVVDFTMPFMNLGISILFKKPQKMAPSLFSFLSPLSLEVWMYMITAYVGVSILLYILARFTPYEWQNPHPCDPEPDTLENQFTILNCLWFAIGSLMQQGCDFLPQAVSTRMVAGMWWFFTLIMISSYTANLAAFLTVERMESPIENAEDLANQDKIKYGSMATGTTYAFFRDSNLLTYRNMWIFMSNTKPSVFVNSNQEGVKRVQESNGKYAYLMESTSIEYVIERNCDLTQIGGLLDSKSYGIALRNRSTYKGKLDEAILTLQENGTLHILKEKWFKQKRGGGKCKEEAGGSSMASELNLSNVGGVFVVLMGGMGLALVVAIGEFLLECWDIAKEDQIPLMKVLSNELRFVFKCRGSSKPVRKKASESEAASTSNNIYGSDVYNYTNKNNFT
ncbi:LOW QUALITY PROTEIN: glutamate receptor ionotropic, kainate 2-like [Portunus trituberculatus]|uniref:LOW QUALITY PROTEIN: glutamate receptor ionotropic, kainate 2-like n=1 Tax=Portunus trituberculatus TaxID=210409 RepID=UPI001E1D0818|nr:LOW QUALITY PROTEIN: glutamate receptor ionotropic, kainate 2-like [Portunus trituberculatus]